MSTTAKPAATVPTAQAVLFSDRRIKDAADLTLQRMSMKIVREIAVSSDNVGIVSLTVLSDCFLIVGAAHKSELASPY